MWPTASPAVGKVDAAALLSPARGDIITVAARTLSPLPWLPHVVPRVFPWLSSPWATIYRPWRGLSRRRGRFVS